MIAAHFRIMVSAPQDGRVSLFLASGWPVYSRFSRSALPCDYARVQGAIANPLLPGTDEKSVPVAAVAIAAQE
jgi:hypothetical protein